jgi:hypothetical protein
MPNNFHFMGVKSSFGCTTQLRDELMDTLMISTSSVEMKVCTYITHLMPLLELMNLWISHDENHLKIYDAIVRKQVFPSRKMSVKLLKCIHMWKVFDILMAWLAYRPVENTVSWVRHSQGLISADYCQASSRKRFCLHVYLRVWQPISNQWLVKVYQICGLSEKERNLCLDTKSLVQ